MAILNTGAIWIALKLACFYPISWMVTKKALTFNTHSPDLRPYLSFSVISSQKFGIIIQHSQLKTFTVATTLKKLLKYRYHTNYPHVRCYESKKINCSNNFGSSILLHTQFICWRLAIVSLSFLIVIDIPLHSRQGATNSIGSAPWIDRIGALGCHPINPSLIHNRIWPLFIVVGHVRPLNISVPHFPF